MRKSMIKTWLIAAALSLLPLVAHGAGMGRLTVNSALGAPLKAEIELVSVKKEEVGSLTAKLASPEQFKQANLDFTAVHARLKLSVETRPDGLPFIKVCNFLLISSINACSFSAKCALFKGTHAGVNRRCCCRGI